MPRLSLYRSALVTAAALAFALPAAPALAISSDGAAPGGGVGNGSLTGSARMDYPIAADDVRFSFNVRADATGDGPRKAHGSMQIRHYVSGENASYFWTAKAQCLQVSGRVAVVTGIITDTSAKLAPWRGQRISFTVADGQPDQVGTSGPRPLSEAPPCAATTTTQLGAMVPAPLMKVATGGYRVSDGKS